MKTLKSKKEITIKNKKTKESKQIKAIIEFEFDKYVLYVFQGTLSKFDILIKYKNDKTRIRTPKHIHWVVDMLIKMQHKKQLAIKFLEELKIIWKDCRSLQNNDYDTLNELVSENINKIQIETYSELSSYGEYPVDFLFVLMLLLATQEKTNRQDAYMFGKIIDELLETDYDIFRIISRAGFTGRK